VWGIVLRENTQMLALGRKLGFGLSKTDEPGELELTIDLRSLALVESQEPKHA
jgi:acetyltransferase